MQDLKVDRGDWIVVCDGRKALILENAGSRKSPSLRTVERREHADRPTREQGSAAPGRVQQSVGSARSSMEQTDWQDEAERDFLHALAARLDAAVKTGETRALVIVAAPRALGMLRQAYTPHIRAVLRKELDKDFVRVPVSEIEARLFS
ncbi:MAG TPA: host attachment protein [Xanthobacteraceae bacterium]|nr:host attachment protein [Xanthobacteraceae bacterium]